MPLDILKINPDAKYPPHRCQLQKFKILLKGKADCTLEDQQFVAQKGAVIKTAANAIHLFKKTQDPKNF